MGAKFNGSSQRRDWVPASFPFSATPFTLACWALPNGALADQVLMSIGDTGSGAYHSIRTTQTIGNIILRTFGTSSQTSASGVNALAGTWYHHGGVFTSDSSRLCYANGVAGTANTNSSTLTENRLTVGVSGDSTPFGFTHWTVAECGAWDVALTAEEMAVLAAGYSPRFVRPQNLLFYAPFVRNQVELMDGTAFTGTAPTVGEHPRIIYPVQRSLWGAVPVAGGGLSIPVAMSSYRRHHLGAMH